MHLDHAWNSLVTMTLQGSVLCLMTGAGLLLLRKGAAASRHLLLALAMSALLAVPFLALLLPHWQVPLYIQAPNQSSGAVAQATSERNDPAFPAGGDAPLLPREASAPAAASVTTTPSAPTPSSASFVSTLPVPSHEAVSAHAERTPFAVAAASASVAGRSRRVHLPVWQSRRCEQTVLAVWLLGVVIALLRLLAGLIGTWRVTSRETIFDPILTQTVRQIQAELGMAQTVTVKQTRAESGLPVPLTWGLLRPTLLLPPTFLEWPQERRRMVVLHELAHIQRADWLLQMLAQITCALYWFHPLVWWTAHRLHAESERACDDTVLLTGVAPLAYAETLLEVIRTMNRSKTSTASYPSLLSIASPPIERRLRAILSPQHRQRPLRRTMLLSSAGTALCAIVLASVQVKAVQAPPPPQTPAGTTQNAAISASARPPGDSVEVRAPAVVGQSGADKPAAAIQKGRSTDEIGVLRQKLDALEMLLVRSQQENKELRQRFRALEAQNRNAASVSKTLAEEAMRQGNAAFRAAETAEAQAAEDFRRAEQAHGGATLLSSAGQLKELQGLLRALHQQQSALEAQVHQSEELHRNGFATSEAFLKAKAELDACKTRIEVVRKQLEAKLVQEGGR